MDETLSEALEKARKYAKDNSIEYDGEIEFEPMKYDSVQRKSYPIISLKGKKTKKYFHVIISRLDCGKYELVCYAS